MDIHTVGSLNRAPHENEVLDRPVDDEFSDLSVGEVIPGYNRYCLTKAILERKYGRKITDEEMDKILKVVLSTMPHEKRVKKKYGEQKGRKWREQLGKSK